MSSRIACMKWLLICFSLLLIITACTTDSAVSQPTPVVIVKALATVYISPTPNAQQLQATRLASSPTPTPLLPTNTPHPTAYVGKFIGEAQVEDFVPFDPSLFRTEISVDASLCDIIIGDDYVTAWTGDARVRENMGCPIQLPFGFFGQVQVFENGVMYQREDTNEIWVILATNSQYYFVSDPLDLSTEGVSAPAGLLVPEGDFGSVWSSIRGLRQELGFAQTRSQRVSLGLQRYDGGTFFADRAVGEVFALLVDGTLFGPYTASQ